VKNPEYYDRRIKQYQKKHGISNAEPKPIIPSKLRIKREIESDPAEDEVAPQKRRKIKGERSVEAVSVSGYVIPLILTHV